MGIIGLRPWAFDGTPVMNGGAVTDPNFSSVKLLLGFEGTDGATTTTDEGGSPHAMTFNGNAQLDTAQAKFGVSSLLLDGSGDYVSALDSADWDFGSGQFTVEFFVRYNSVTDVEFISQWDLTTSLCAFKFGRTAASGLVFNFYDSTTTLRAVIGAWTPTTGTWYHLAADRDVSGVLRIYVDGTMLNKATLAQTFQNSSKALNIGRIDHSTPRYLNGWLDEVRITKGVARYASDGGFSIPTSAFPRS